MRISRPAAGPLPRDRNVTPFVSASRRRIVEKAEAFLAAHIDESVPLARICQAVGVSERSLRNAFYDVRGMSPKRYSVRVRLVVVRRALRQAEAARRTVTTIATGHGFFELGRFAATYKSVFGETPSETLRAAGERSLDVAS